MGVNGWLASWSDIVVSPASKEKALYVLNAYRTQVSPDLKFSIASLASFSSAILICRINITSLFFTRKPEIFAICACFRHQFVQT